MALLNIEWVRRVGGLSLVEVELAGDGADDRAPSLCASLASGLAFGGLEEAVERLDEAVGAAGSGPRGDAVDVSADHFGDGFHGFDLIFPLKSVHLS